jgi:2-polyprenyl-3-methyl-5-hydroxy-6-metoxy-1,4-benzoquinol methylase
LQSESIAMSEASLAPHEGDTLSLPFDQYGRMRIAQNCLHALYTEVARVQGTERLQNGSEPAASIDTPLEGSAQVSEGAGFRLRVLDVGGYPGVLRQFADESYFDVSVLDVVPDDGTIPQYIQGTGMGLPFEEASFDVVTALDTLEHIPHADRDLFLQELIRVARFGVLLINPIQSIEADLAEETLNEYIKWVLEAKQEQLAEHRDYGLPSFQHTIDRFSEAGWQLASFTTANVHNWLLMMLAKHYLISMRDESATAFERTLDRFYNLTFSESDMAEPAYRGVLVAVRPGLEPALHAIRAKYPPPAQSDSANAVRLGLAQTLMSMLNLKLNNHENLKLRAQMERRDRHIAGLERKVEILESQVDQREIELEAQRDHSRDLQTLMAQTREAFGTEFEKQADYIARLEKDLGGKDEHIRYLEQLLQGIESGRVMRLTRALSRFLGK